MSRGSILEKRHKDDRKKSALKLQNRLGSIVKNHMRDASKPSLGSRAPLSDIKEGFSDDL